MNEPATFVSVFHQGFLDRLASLDTKDAASSAAEGEAEAVGPWTIEPRPDGWAVQAEGEMPEALVTSHDTALLLAAVLPGTGRDPAFARLLKDGTPSGFPLVGPQNEILGYVRHFNPDLSHALHVLECLRRSPVDLARLLFASRRSGLLRAGRLVSLWEEEAP